jgi:CheY-like chemotaxis protein
MTEETQHGQLQALVVEDDRKFADILCRQIEAECLGRLVAVPAYDLATALDLLRTMRFDLVILDLLLPWTDAPRSGQTTQEESYQAIKALTDPEGTPVVSISGRPPDKKLSEAIEAADKHVLSRFVSKPFSIIHPMQTLLGEKSLEASLERLESGLRKVDRALRGKSAQDGR